MTEQEKMIDLVTEVRDNCYCQAQDYEDPLLFEKAHILDSAVEKLQRARWISCMEKMPEIGKRVLFCTRKGYVGMAEYQESDMNFDHLYDGRPKEQAVTLKDYSFAQTRYPEDSIAAVTSPCFSQNSHWESDPVIAWMELPESYREDKQEDEIVHCRECRHWKVRPGYGGYRTCKRYGYTNADFFCPWGKRL